MGQSSTSWPAGTLRYLDYRKVPDARRQLNTAIPMIYGILVAVAALFFSAALLPVAVVGAMRPVRNIGTGSIGSGGALGSR